MVFHAVTLPTWSGLTLHHTSLLTCAPASLTRYQLLRTLHTPQPDGICIVPPLYDTLPLFAPTFFYLTLIVQSYLKLQLLRGLSFSSKTGVLHPLSYAPLHFFHRTYNQCGITYTGP